MKTRKNITLDHDLLQRVDEFAERTHRNRSEVIALALERLLDDDEKIRMRQRWDAMQFSPRGYDSVTKTTYLEANDNE